MNKVLIYGAGALGRGFIAPFLFSIGYEIYFVDRNAELINELNRKTSYKTAQITNNQYKIHEVFYENAFFWGQEDYLLKDMNYIITSVGQRNISQIAQKLKSIQNTHRQIIISCENDRSSVDTIKRNSGNKNCFFAIPDVIVSNTSPNNLQKMDPLCVISEKGELVLEKGNYYIDDKIIQLDSREIAERWACKFFLHNTPHAAIAYLGWKKGFKYIHEAMKNTEISECVYDIIDVTKKCLITQQLVNPKLANDYTIREIERFKNELLFDPIERVAREPLRKLKSSDRLILPLKMIERCGENYLSLCKVINTAFEYFNPPYDDGITELVKKNGKVKILNEICGLTQNQKSYKLLIDDTFL